MDQKQFYALGNTKEDKSHIWGTYKELLLGPTLMSRIIKFYLGGKTSVHRHAVDEIIFIELGEIEIQIGSEPSKLQRTVYGPGSVLLIPAGMWHATSGVSGVSDDQPFALGVEYVFGDNKSGKYLIERHEPAHASPHHSL